MKMQLVGMTAIREGISKKDEAEYCSQRLYFNGKSLDVEGTVAKEVFIDYMKFNNLPSFEIGKLYDVDLSDRGYLRNIELLGDAPKKGN
jgi:hypothetical protein